MDKTTTWLVRGASAIVIIFGIGYFVKPQITKLANIRSEEYLRNPKAYCEKLVRKHLNKNTRILKAQNINVDLGGNAEYLFDMCESYGGANMSEYSKCQINAQFFDYTRKERNKAIRLFKSDPNAGANFVAELWERNKKSCDKFSE